MFRVFADQVTNDLGKKLKDSHNNLDLSMQYWNQKKAYKSMIRKKRQASDFLHLKLSDLKTSNPKNYRKNHIRQKLNSKESIPIDVNHLGSYFGDLLKGPDNLNC